MKIAVFVFNPQGLQLARQLERAWEKEVFIYPREEQISLGEQVARVWKEMDGLIFFGAAGMAIRVIAPLLESKVIDPAVLVIDGKGQYVISLLSGHLGGANQLARKVANLLGATPIITTATDVLGKTSVEEWAMNLGFRISNHAGLVRINKAIVNGETIRIYTELAPEIYREHELIPQKTRFLPLSQLASHGGQGPIISITRDPKELKAVDLDLKIPTLVVGIGCRKGIPKEKVRQLVEEVFQQEGWSLAAIKKIVSVDRKKDEKAILALARELRVPFETYPPNELEEVLGAMPQMETSPFVKKKIGVGAVCEPAAVLGSHRGKIVLGKRKGEGPTSGVTVAVAQVVLP